MDDLPADWARAIEASFLGRLPERTWRQLFDRAHQIDAPAKTVLYPETEQGPTAHLVLILDGLVRVYRTSRATSRTWPRSSATPTSRASAIAS